MGKAAYRRKTSLDVSEDESLSVATGRSARHPVCKHKAELTGKVWAF